VARNRQRAKQRQAERRARRLAEERGGGREPSAEESQAGDGTSSGARVRDDRRIDDPTTVEPSAAVPPELAVGAPPQDEGFSEQLIKHDPVLGDRPILGEPEPPATEEEALEEIEDWEVEEEPDAPDAGAGEAGYEARGRRGRVEAAARPRSRVVQFLIASGPSSSGSSGRIARPSSRSPVSCSASS
jgi:hypothetical protein